MILTHKRLLVDVFLTRRLSKPLAFCEFASVNFEPCIVELSCYTSEILSYTYSATPNLCSSLLQSLPKVPSMKS